MDEDETQNRIQLPDGFVGYRFISVPKSEKFSEEVNYGSRYVYDGTGVLRYDSSLGYTKDTVSTSTNPK